MLIHHSNWCTNIFGFVDDGLGRPGLIGCLLYPTLRFNELCTSRNGRMIVDWGFCSDSSNLDLEFNGFA